MPSKGKYSEESPSVAFADTIYSPAGIDDFNLHLFREAFTVPELIPGIGLDISPLRINFTSEMVFDMWSCAAISPELFSRI